MPSVTDILKNHEEKKAKAPTGKASPSSLALLWKKRVALLGEGGYVKDLTGKEVGQLKHLVKALGDQSNQVVDWALQNWPSFAWEVKSKKGLSSAPDTPVVGFLVQYHDVAVQLIASPAPVKTGPKAVPPIDKPIVVKENTPVEQVGAVDIEATLALLNQMSGS